MLNKHAPQRRQTASDLQPVNHVNAKRASIASVGDVARGGPSQRPQKGRRGPLEKFFLRRLAHEEAYAEYLTSLSIDTGVSEDDLERELEPVSLCCWETARAVIAETEWTSDVNALRGQVQELQDKLNLCNLTSLKAISNLKAKETGQAPAFAEEHIHFHESLAYLDPLTRELVMGIILDKMNQIANGDAPPAFMEQLLKAMAARAKAGEDSDEDAPQSRKAKKRMREQQEAMDRLEKELAETKKAHEACHVGQCDQCHAEIDALGIHLGHDDDLPEEVRLKMSQDLARRRLRELEKSGLLQQSQREACSQTDLTGAYLQELFDASAALQATCSQLRAKLEALEGEPTQRILRETQESFRLLEEAQNVFNRLWDDTHMRSMGIHRRERAPEGPKAVKTVLRAKELPPQPMSYVLPIPAGERLPAHLLRHIDFGNIVQTDWGVPDTVDDEMPDEDLDVQGLGLGLDHIEVACELDSESPSPKSKESPRPRLGSNWGPVPVQKGLSVPGAPKFIRKERKMVSLALLSPGARTTAEASLQKPLFDLGNTGPIETMSAHVSSPPAAELESVSEFLRQRRQARDSEPPSQSLQHGASSGARGVPKNYPLSRLGKSSSLPALAHGA